MRSGRCFFAGDRTMPKLDEEKLQKRIEELIIEMEANGVYEFFSGASLGFDYLAGMAVSEVKKSKPHICLRLFLPCYGYEKGWTDKEKYQFNMFKAKCDSFQYVTEDEYKRGCMQKRDSMMIDMCGTCICFYNSSESDTEKILEYAEEAGCRIINLADEF